MQRRRAFVVDPTRVTALKRRCYQQDYASQNMIDSNLTYEPWSQVAQYLSPLQLHPVPTMLLLRRASHVEFHDVATL